VFTPRSAPGSRPRARRSTLTGLALLVAVLALSPLASARPSPTRQIVLSGYGSSVLPAGDGDSVSLTGPAATFRISGTVSGLYPGRTKPLVLTVRNPSWSSLAVTSITTTVQGPSATCTKASLSVGAFSGLLLVAPFGVRTTSVPATLRSSTPDACEGARFLLRYYGLGRRT
jgi:hypothetical protein